MTTKPIGLIPPSAAPDAWEGQERISRQITAWSAVSIFGGSAAALAGLCRGNRAMRAFGAQNAAWGLVDLAIAGFGEVRRRSRMAKIENPGDPQVQDDEWHSLRRILLLNAGLDVCYVAAGLAGLAWSLRGTRGRADRTLHALAGHSSAVVVQGGFLLAFDIGHARAAGHARRVPDGTRRLGWCR